MSRAGGAIGMTHDPHQMGHPRARPHRPHLRLRPGPGARRRARGGRLPVGGPGGRLRRGVRHRRIAAYGSYEELVADPQVDVVYIASPHALHLEHARLAFEAGKHVLCEKPLTLSVAEAEEMIALATEHDRFLMEAMWTACHPVILEVQRRIRAGDLGTPRHLHAELGFVVPPDASDPDARPGARRERAARHGHLPAHARAPDARRGGGAGRDRAPVGRRDRPRRRDQRPLPGRRAGVDVRVDDLVVLAPRRDRHRHRPPVARGLPPPGLRDLGALRGQPTARPAARRSGSPARSRSSATASATRSPRWAAASTPG